MKSVNEHNMIKVSSTPKEGPLSETFHTYLIIICNLSNCIIMKEICSKVSFPRYISLNFPRLDKCYLNYIFVQLPFLNI